MNPANRLKLFNKLKAKHPDWAIAFLNGWVQGVSEELRRRLPSAVLREAAEGKSPDKYAIGYMCGYAMARGPSVVTGHWYAQGCNIAGRT